MFGIITLAALTVVAALIAVAVGALISADDVARRLVVTDTAVQLTVVALLLLAILQGASYYLDAALALALLSFVSSIAVAAEALHTTAEEDSKP